MTENFAVFNFNPTALPAEFLQALGLVMATGSAAEQLIADVIGSLARIDTVPRIALTAHMTGPVKADAALALAEYAIEDAAVFQAFSTTFKALGSALKARHEFAHAHWHIRGNEVYSAAYTARGAVRTKLKLVRATDITRSALAIHQATLDLHEVMFNHGLYVD